MTETVMNVEFSELPGWLFDADEISAGVFKAFGRDRAGRRVEATGLDAETLIAQCKQAALEMMSREHKRSDDAPPGKP